MLKGQLHTHSNFSDGRLTVQEIANLYSSLGFDFIAYTDHDYLIRAGYREAIAAVKTNLIIFCGIELTVHTRWGYVHIGQISGDREKLHIFNHPAEYGLSIKQYLECLEIVGRKHKIDAVELSHYGFYTPEYDCELIPYPKVATDDSHVKEGCGRAWIEMEGERDKDSILRQIRAGDFTCRFAKGNRPILLSKEE